MGSEFTTDRAHCPPLFFRIGARQSPKNAWSSAGGAGHPRIDRTANAIDQRSGHQARSEQANITPRGMRGMAVPIRVYCLLSTVLLLSRSAARVDGAGPNVDAR